MKLDCDIIRDLLPLHAEGLTSPKSAALVEEHLATCGACRNELKEAKAKPPLSAAALPMQKIRRGITCRRWLAVALAASLILAFATAFLAYATDWQELPYQEGDFTFTKRGNQLIIGIRRDDVAVSLTGAGDPERPGLMYHELSQSTLRFGAHRLRGANRAEVIPFLSYSDGSDGKSAQGYTPRELVIDLQPGSQESIYYVKTGEPAVLVYGPDLYPDGGYMLLPRLALIYYVRLAAALAAALALLNLAFRKRPRVRRVLTALMGLPLAYLGAQLMVKGFSTMSYDSLLRDLRFILVCAAFLYAAWLLYFQQRRMRDMAL